MRLTCNVCVLITALNSLMAGIYALSGFNLLLFLCLNNAVVYKSFLAVSGVAALFNVYALIVFKPYKGLK